MTVRAFRGPNPHARSPVVHADVVRASGETVPTAPLFAAFPHLTTHACEPDCPLAGPSVPACDPAHALMHLARELVRAAGQRTSWGRVTHASDGARIVFAYDDEASALLAADLAAEIVEQARAGVPIDADDAVRNVAERRAGSAPGPSTQSILDEAHARGIPTLRLDDSHYQLGHASKQVRIQATLTSRTSAIAVETADDKVRTKKVLRDAGVPTARGDVCDDLDAAVAIASRIGYPVVVKPREGNHGRGVSVGVRTAEELELAFARARDVDRDVIVEEMVQGNDHRILVIGHTFVAAARRDAAQVVGDGVRSIRALIDAENADPRRGEGHEKPLTRIEVDEDTLRVLTGQALTLDSIPPAGRVVRLKSTANLSTGGTATDVTDDVHAAVREMAERVSRIVGLDVCGIDVVARDLAAPLEETGGGVVEVNAAPGFRMHLSPTHGRPRNVAAPLVDSFFPPGETGRIPIVAITGTNGKTTTTRLTAHILERAGARLGLACTDGVEIRGRRVLSGDYSGPGGAEAVLRDPTVTHAVLEVARGGILRRGLGFDECDVGVLLNIDNDHLGSDGITTLDELAHVKATVVAAVRREGVAVLNADDPRSLAAASRVRGRVVLFALDPDNAVVRAHVAAGGEAVSVRDGTIVRLLRDGATPIVRILDIPLTLGGRAECNVRNALAATAATLAVGLSVGDVATGLATFHATPAQLPGRLNLIEKGGVRILVDYGHNPPALRALASTLASFGGGRRIVSASATGNRRDEDLREFGEWVARLYDEVYLSDADPRGRPPGETPALVAEGIRRVAKPGLHLEVLEDEVATIEAALASAAPGDLVVLQAEDVRLAISMAEAWEPVPVAPSPAPRAIDVPA